VGGSIGIATSLTPPAPEIPSSGPLNSVLQVDVDVDADSSSFAGFAHHFENPALDTWTPQDWSMFGGIGFWFHGSNSNADLFFDILDNRTPGSTTDDAERFTVAFVDDFVGWQFLEFPFSAFMRRDIGNDAPDDGLTLTEVWGYGLGVSDTSGPRIFYLDDVELRKVPEPGSLTLLGLGLAGLGAVRRRQAIQK